MRINLKMAILAAGKTQRKVAAETGITENRVSEIVCGWTDPTPTERAALAAAVGRPMRASLFADTSGPGESDHAMAQSA